jgi:hypothetical protein
MNYTKPEVVALGAAISEVQGNKNSTTSADGNHIFVTVSAYEADE